MKGQIIPSVKTVRMGPPIAPKILKEICKMPEGTTESMKAMKIVMAPITTARRRRR